MLVELMLAELGLADPKMTGRSAVAHRMWRLGRPFDQGRSSMMRLSLSVSLRGFALLLWGGVVLPVARAETYLWRPVKIGGGGFITGYSSDASGSRASSERMCTELISGATRPIGGSNW